MKGTLEGQVEKFLNKLEELKKALDQMDSDLDRHEKEIKQIEKTVVNNVVKHFTKKGGKK